MVEPDTLIRLSEDVASATPPPILGPIQRDGDGALDFVGAVFDEKVGVPVDRKAHETQLSQMPIMFDTSYIRGAGLFVCREHFERIGLFDDDYYLYYDETDWCYRARFAGYAVMMTQNASIIHIGSALWAVRSHRCLSISWFAMDCCLASAICRRTSGFII